MRSEERGNWYLLTGLLIGILLGLGYAWVVQPVEYVDTSPASLRADFKDQYRALIASAYVANGDLVRAKARLDLLGDADVYAALSEQAQRTLAQNSNLPEARALGLLAIAIGKNGASQTAWAPATGISTLTATQTSPPTDTPSPLPSETPTSEPTATLTFTAAPPTIEPTAIPELPTPSPPSGQAGAPTGTTKPRPTNTPSPTPLPSVTPGAPFILTSRIQSCDQQLAQPMIQVEAVSGAGQPLSGVLVIVTWAGGEERFFTGLKPEKSLGYADYAQQPGVVYSLRLGETGEIVNDLSAVQCNRAGNQFWGAWILRFTQP